MTQPDEDREPTTLDKALHPLAWLDATLIERELIRVGNSRIMAHRAALLAFWSTVEGRLPSVRLPTPREGVVTLLRPISTGISSVIGTTTRYVFIAGATLAILTALRLTRK